MEATAARAERLLPSGRVLWGLDSREEIFSAYGIGGQPAGAIVAADGSLISTWRGRRSSADLREALDSLLASA